ncbi:hypothetical protein SDC9_46975 [bioreactor metagenome]|uniref:Uncharacterized protein n=1 Tax=bioreactor metagenome TaxID=1076179 RepID=A0A644WAA6_9ZZZZ
MKHRLFRGYLHLIKIVLSRVSSILLRVSSGVGANLPAVYVESHDYPIPQRPIKTPNAEKAQKVWAFRIEKVPTNCIIS